MYCLCICFNLMYSFGLKELCSFQVDTFALNLAHLPIILPRLIVANGSFIRSSLSE
uniref:Uncharacterized protein n=1 Tax=Papilio xuthus TaxID=66420 RepID=I4DQK5_PAPXU|nr:unknown unsecreted protein [Papilio xuthus]